MADEKYAMKGIFERLLKGETIGPGDPDFKDLVEKQVRVWKLINTANIAPTEAEFRSHLSKVFPKPLDSSVTIFAPFYTNVGQSIHFGKNVFVNRGCTFLDLGGITIDNNVMIGPNVLLATEGHPVEVPRHYLFAKPVHICSNVWIGAGAIILPGVTVGENSMVAAGAVVNKDVPPNTVVGGTPAKVLRELKNSKL